MTKATGITEYDIQAGDKEGRPCDWQHVVAASVANPAGTGLHSQHFTDLTGQWLEVRWLCDRNKHVIYVYEDTRGLNR